MKPTRRSTLALGLVALLCLAAALIHKYMWVGRYQVLHSIEAATGHRLPQYSDLELEAATEFAYVGKMRVTRDAATNYLSEMRFQPQADFNYLRTWGRYSAFFDRAVGLEGFLGAEGVLKDKHSWEFAYDPKSEQMWFVFGYTLAPPPERSNKK